VLWGQERHKKRDSRLECQMDSVLKLRTTEGGEWPGLYACWPASLAILEYTGSCCMVLRRTARRFHKDLACDSMQFHAGTLTISVQPYH
jgi:hypothetical protein